MTKQQSYSMENYLEMIAMLSRENNIVRVTQLSTALGVRKSSVSAALTKLAKDGLVIHEKYGFVELTPEGKKIAYDVLHRHEVIEQFLVEILGVNPEIAWKDACEMEHHISLVTIQKLTMFIKYVISRSPDNSELIKWLNNNQNNYLSGKARLTTSNMIDDGYSQLID